MAVDVSMYGRNKNSTSLGDILGAVQGISGVVNNFRKTGLARKEEEDNQYMVNTLGDIMKQGNYDYNNPNDLTRMNNELIRRITAERPDLSNKALGNFNASQNNMIAMQKNLQELENKKLAGKETETKTTGYQLDNQSKAFQNKKDQADYMTELFGDVTPENYDSKVENAASYGIDVTGLKGNAQGFFASPEKYLNTFKRTSNIYDQVIKAENAKQEGLDTQLKQGDARWQDREKEASVNQKNRTNLDGTMNVKPVSQTIALQLSSTEQGIKMLDNMVENSPSFKTLSNSPLDKLRALNPWDEDVKSFDQLVATTKQVIGKGLEGGVLRKEDEVKYEKILPKLGEPLNIRERKAQQLRDMLVNKYNTDISSLGAARADVSTFPQMQNKTYGQQVSTGNKYLDEVRARRAAGGQK